ncbi:MAG: DUF2243 domain-containing protein [Actinomycetota bacterium]|nr:DUF2243 domain-containing protein [Actinomycetota bacterium]
MTWARDRLGYVVIGIAVGALADGVVLHQVLQWHHLWSAKTPDTTVDGLEENVLADGIFHLAFLVVLLVGVLTLVRRRVELRPLVGLGLTGWGVFHVIDQFVFHLALEAHHIRMVDNYQVYDWTFFALGLALIAVGLVVAGSPNRTRAPGTGPA